MPASKAAYCITRADKASIRFADGLARVDAAVAPKLGLPQDGAIGRGSAQSIEHWPAYPDSVAALKRLKQRFKLVAMTNGQRWALEHMQRTLGNPFDDSITVDEALCDKPDPRFFAFARGRISPQPRRRGPARHPLYRRGPAARLHRRHAGIRAYHARLSPYDIGQTGRRS